MLSHSVFNPFSPQALAVSNFTIVLMIISGIICLGITAIIVYDCIVFRRRPGQTGEPPQQFGVVKIEIIWTAIPTVLVLILFGASVAVMKMVAPPDGDPPADLVVIGHQWWWEIRYPNGVVTANEIHVQVGKRYYVAVKSVDVIHSLWIPQLAPKMDLVPGQTDSMYIEADKAGVYDGNCVEFCGAGHAWMLVRVIAQPPAQFAAWERQQLSPPAIPSSGPAAAGAKLFGTLTCQNCHTEANIGPDLSHVGSRETLAAGRLTNTPANMYAWLQDPGQIKPGVHMPNFHLTPTELTDLTAYLESTGGTSAPASTSSTPIPASKAATAVPGAKTPPVVKPSPGATATRVIKPPPGATALAKTTAVAATATPTGGRFLSWNSAAHTAKLTLVAGLTGALGGFNFNGYGNGKMVVSIPRGYHVTVTFSNKTAVPHSAVITSYAARNATINFPLAFPGASLPNAQTGITAGKTAQFSFTASKTGTYAIVCAVPGHAEQGMWDVFKVTSGGQPSLTT